jgi:hypothetical protein
MQTLYFPCAYACCCVHVPAVHPTGRPLAPAGSNIGSSSRLASDEVRRRLVAAAEAFVDDDAMGPLVVRLHVQRALSPCLQALSMEDFHQATWQRVKEKGTLEEKSRCLFLQDPLHRTLQKS